MTSPLRSFREFESLERKRRELQKAGARWRATMQNVAVPGYLEYQKARSKAQAESRSNPDSGLLRDRVSEILASERVAPYMPGELIQFQEELSGRVAPYRAVPARPVVAGHEPMDPRLVVAALERFVDWLNSPAFAEMHPVEQMTLCQLRLYEIWPYDSDSDLLADLFALRVLYGATGIVPWPLPEEVPEFYSALSDAFGFATKRLVEFNLKACERACDETIRRL